MTDVGSHFREIGHSPACARAAILQLLKQRYGEVSSGRFALRPNYMWYICE